LYSAKFLDMSAKPFFFRIHYSNTRFIFSHLAMNCDTI